MVEKSNAITAEQICFRYPNCEVDTINRVSLTIEKGCCTGLIGPNGAGKSTILSLLSGLLSPTSGTIHYVNQEPNQSINSYVKQHVALVPQEYAFYNDLTIEQNLKYFASLANKKQTEIIESALQKCQLNNVRKQKVKSLSGGYKRRLNIAIALLKHPSIIFLDEPTVGIDPVSRQLIIDLLQGLKQQGCTIIYTSHLLNEVEQICEYIYGVKAGNTFNINSSTSQHPLQVTWKSPLTETDIAQLTDLPCSINIVNGNKVELIDKACFSQFFALTEYILNNEIVDINYSKNNLEKYYLELFVPQ